MINMPESLEGSMNSENKWSAHRIVLKELVWPFWTKSADKKSAWGLSVILLFLMAAMVYALLMLNRWNQGFYDALQKLDQAEFLNQLWRFFFIALAYALIVAYKFYVLQSLAVRWRHWLTEKNLTTWLSNKNFYFWQILPNNTDNPDQRLSEDIHELTDLSLEISEKTLRELITFVSFIGILWGLSSSLKFEVLGYHVEVYRYLVWACMLYAAVGTWITHKIGFPLSKLNFMQQKFEADFRYLLVRLRENSESVALSQGEGFEKQKLSSKFSQVVANFKDIIRRQKQLLVTTNIYSQFAYIFPFVVASPKVFTKEITLGQLFQISSAFGQVQGSVSVFVDLYPKLMRLNSVVLRLGGFLLSLDQMKASEPSLDADAKSISIKDLSVFTPQGRLLLGNLNLQLQPGERVLVMAPSGKGKSTLLRTLNGLWPYTKGHFEGATSNDSLVLSQKPYLPMGALKDVLTYPENSQKFTEDVLKRALGDVQLTHLHSLLNEEADWSQRLSTGEQQRLCFARIFIRQPRIVLLDEATSSLEKEMEGRLFRTLLEKMPAITLLTLAHDSEDLKAFHQRVIAIP
jgi:putative ATP-binding cassette transporter